MEFGLDKCAKSVIKKGKKVETENIQLDRYEIQNLDEDTPYKYLGMEENENLMHKEMKKKLRKEYLSRLKKICKTSLTNKNKITAINHYNQWNSKFIRTPDRSIVRELQNPKKSTSSVDSTTSGRCCSLHI